MSGPHELLAYWEYQVVSKTNHFKGFYRSVTTTSKEKKSVKTEYPGGIFVPKEGASPQPTWRRRGTRSLNFGAKSTHYRLS